VVDVTAQVSLGRNAGKPLRLVTKILDAAGREIAASNQIVAPLTALTMPYETRLIVPKPHLWNGRQDPYLYRAIVELRSATGVVDAVEQPLGVRYYRVDPNLGFFLNGKHYPIYGVCRHQDRQDKGWAISEADMEADIELIKEIGATAVRCAHYQHRDYFYSLCDRAGILVWAEIPQVNAVHATPEFETTSRNQLLDLIRQNINHPSIFAWSLFNEIAGGGKWSTDDPHRILQNLNHAAHGEDPTRPTIAATCVEFFPQMEKIPDLLGWNNYPGWYGGPNYTIPGQPSGYDSLKTFGASLDRRRYQSRSGGFCIAEYGAGANPRQHEENPNPPVAAGQWHPEEWQDIVHESDWAAIKSHPFIWGSFVWNMFDFCVSTRHEGGSVARNDKGLVTFDHQLRKDAFYFYKANWSPDPTLYIASRRFTERTNALTGVKVYSNLPKATLRVNGTELGARTSNGNGVILWQNVRLSSGENKIEVAGKRQGQTFQDSCVWTLTR
ncbi:MAG TPA: glycoside hydrolase family 2 TIM barrel-domain containing protein, partial [Verrucomicrobiae bacterium]